MPSVDDMDSETHTRSARSRVYKSPYLIFSLTALTAAVLFVLAILVVTLPARSDIRIGRDDGGAIRDYQGKVEAARYSGQRIVIDGRCASACTLYLNLPHNRICATPRATFVFHTASDKLLGLPDWRGNEQLMNAYPPHVRIAIGQRGGLWLTPISIRGTALVPTCR